MPMGPQGQKRPAGVIGKAVHTAKIATGETEKSTLNKSAKPKSGLARLKVSFEKVTDWEHTVIAPKEASGRWQL